MPAVNRKIRGAELREMRDLRRREFAFLSTIEEEVVTETPMGSTKAWSTIYADVPCDLNPISANEVESAGQTYAAATYVYVCPVDIVINPGARITVIGDSPDGGTFTKRVSVLGVMAPSSDPVEAKLACTDRPGATS